MRVLVFFDLPMVTSENLRCYRRFRKALIKNGFFMMQESVYCKLVLNSTAEKNVIATIRREKPPEGLIQVLSVTEKQFAKMEYILGDSPNDIINTDERLIIL